MTLPTTAPPAPLNVHEYETAARAVLSPMAYDFLAGGAGDEVTLRASRAAFERWRFLPRVLRGVHPVSTATTVLGQALALLIGRPVLWGLAIGGTAGVRHVLELIQGELTIDLALCASTPPPRRTVACWFMVCGSDHPQSI